MDYYLHDEIDSELRKSLRLCEMFTENPFAFIDYEINQLLGTNVAYLVNKESAFNASAPFSSTVIKT